MASARKKILHYLLPALTIIVLIALLTAALLRLGNIQQEMRHNTNINMTWVTYYANLEGLRLLDAVQKKALDPQANVDVAFRYKMLISRVQLLQDGPQYRVIEEIGLGSELHRQTQNIEGLDFLLTSLPLSPAELTQVQQVLGSFVTMMMQAASQAMTIQWEELGAGIDSNRNAVLAIIFIMIAILVGSIFISVQLFLALRQAHESERIKQRELILKKQLEDERQIAEIYQSFGSMVSHQFRTPLAIIDASMQRLIRSKTLTIDEAKKRALKVKAATERLTRLIDSILNANRYLEQVDLRLQSACLVTLTKQVIDEISTVKNTRKVRFINKTTSEDTTRVYCDPILVSQIILNFMSNAAKYSAPNQTIEVSVWSEPDWVCCAVKDRGRGISEADLPYIFQRYFRSTGVSDVVGTGIGLYIAEKLIDLQQGKIYVHSVEGEGSTFTVRLPKVHA